MKIQIRRHRYTNACLYETEIPDGTERPMRRAVVEAVAKKTVLQDADLQGAYLQGAYLQDADLRGAYLQGADLRGADLQDADLQDAYLQDANLRGAYLQDADLRDADLRGAYLGKGPREDLHEILDAAPAEVPGLLTALREGRIDGSVYDGPCACLVGTIAKVRGCEYTELDGITPNGDRPAERWFMSIRPGDTPEKSRIAKITEEWIVAWQERRAAVAKPYADLLREARVGAAPELAAKIDALVGAVRS